MMKLNRGLSVWQKKTKKKKNQGHLSNCKFLMERTQH